jgi:hypothetical protein
VTLEDQGEDRKLGIPSISPVRDEFRRMKWKTGANEIDNTGSATFGFFPALTTAMYSRQFHVFELTCLHTSLYHVVEVPSSEGSEGFFRKHSIPPCILTTHLTSSD